MIFKTTGEKSNPAILFFHAMGVTGESSMPTVKFLREDYFCILPTSTVYCPGQRYRGKEEELRQVEAFLEAQGVRELALVTASSLGADLATAFLARGRCPVQHVFFDGGQFARIPRGLRYLSAPFLYLAIKSLYRSRGRTLKKILWCDDEAIKPYFIEAGKNLTWRNLLGQLKDSLKNEPFPQLPEELQARTFWEFGSREDHFKYRPAVMERYPRGNFPVFRDYQHMQYQIRDPEGFGALLREIIEHGRLPELPFLEKN